MRVVKGRDSFNPVLYGRFTQGLSGTHMRVMLTFHPFVWLFIIAWTCFGLYAAYDGLDSDPAIPVFMVLFLWAIAVPIFYYDARKSKRLLQECVGRIVDEASR
jgi:heme/copper-type cytochrome/quinol oxidase subunit 2